MVSGVIVVYAFSALLAYSYAAPAGQQTTILNQQGGFGFNAGGTFNTTALISTLNQKIQLLRQFCPQLFQVIDKVVQNVTSQIFSVVGRTILRNGLGGSSDGGNGESRVSIVLPTFPPDDEYDDEEDTESNVNDAVDVRIVNSRTSTTETSNGIALSVNDIEREEAPFTEIELLQEDDKVTTTETSVKFDIKVIQNGNIVNTIPVLQESIKKSDGFVHRRSPAAATLKRVIREVEADQNVAASGGNLPDPADLTDVEAEDSEREKRYLPFSGEAHVSAGGGSGNFLFDIIRLIAGSGATEESDEKDNGAGAGGIAEIDVAKTADGYTEGIPGPITRLFVIANRGLANLVQDLILRLAQTSERIVNFKARLITALI